MKRLAIFAAAMILCIAASAQDGRAFYNKYSDEQGVSAVYISPAMFRIVGHIPDNALGEDYRYLKPLVKSLSGMYVLSSTNNRVNDRMYRDISKHVKDNSFELLMEMKDGGQTVRIYTLGDENTITNLVLYDNGPFESNYICIDGTMPRKAVEEAIANSTR